MNQRVNVSLKGGGTMARYYVSANFSQDNGALKVDPKTTTTPISILKYPVENKCESESYQNYSVRYSC